MAQVTRQIVDPHERPDLPIHLFGLRDATETTLRRVARVLGGKALAKILVCGFSKMARNLVVKVSIHPPRMNEGP